MATTGRDDKARFRDPLARLCCFAGEILVRCPRCDGRARVLPDPLSEVADRHLWLRRRLSCLNCGYTDLWAASPGRAGNVTAFSGPEDPYFGHRLWLAGECCGKVLWAYNEEHLDLLAAYVTARLRERGKYMGTMSLVERLPRWVKDAKHRDEVLRVIRRLRATLR